MTVDATLESEESSPSEVEPEANRFGWKIFRFNKTWVFSHDKWKYLVTKMELRVQDVPGEPTLFNARVLFEVPSSNIWDDKRSVKVTLRLLGGPNADDLAYIRLAWRRVCGPKAYDFDLPGLESATLRPVANASKAWRDGTHPTDIAWC